MWNDEFALFEWELKTKTLPHIVMVAHASSQFYIYYIQIAVNPS
jgi:hypothetical protein